MRCASLLVKRLRYTSGSLHSAGPLYAKFASLNPMNPQTICLTNTAARRAAQGAMMSIFKQIRNLFPSNLVKELIQDLDRKTPFFDHAPSTLVFPDAHKNNELLADSLSKWACGEDVYGNIKARLTKSAKQLLQRQDIGGAAANSRSISSAETSTSPAENRTSGDGGVGHPPRRRFRFGESDRAQDESLRCCRPIAGPR